MAIYNAEGDCIAANEAVARIVGATLEQVLSQNYHQIASWKQSGLYAAALRVAKSSREERLEQRLTTSFGKTAVFDFQIVPVKATGEVCLLIAAEDITSRKRTEAEAAAREAVARIFMESGPLEATYQKLADILSTALGFPAAAAELYDAARQEMVFVGLAGIAGMPPGTRVPVDQTLSGKVATGNEAMCTDRASQCPDYRCEGLRELGVETFICVPFHVDGEVAGTLALADPVSRSDAELWLAELESIAASLSLEIERKRAEDELAHSEERFRLAERAGEMGVWERDLSTNEVTWSTNVVRLFGMDPDTFGGSFEAFVEAVHPEDRERVEDEISAGIAAGTGFVTKYRVVLADGSVRWLIDAALIFDREESHPGRLVGTVRDITERKRADERLHDQLEELQRWQHATLKREDRVLDLKHEVNALLNESGQPIRYPRAEES
jgi:PAS domain S-box-containing protein